MTTVKPPCPSKILVIINREQWFLIHFRYTVDGLNATFDKVRALHDTNQISYNNMRLAIESLCDWWDQLHRS